MAFGREMITMDRLSALFSIIISLAAVALGVVLGFLVAVIRSTHDMTGRFRVLNVLCHAYLTVIRGTPVVVQLLIIYFVIFGSVDVSKVLVAIVAFGVNSGAYVAEIIRSGIMSVDRGQMEAGRSLGMSKLQATSKIILPQALRYILPAIGNECIALLKETSVAGYVAVVDVTKAATNIRNKTYDAVNPILLLALIYLVMVIALTRLLAIMERRLRKSDGK